MSRLKNMNRVVIIFRISLIITTVITGTNLNNNCKKNFSPINRRIARITRPIATPNTYSM